ncbi:MAG TPA: hypothetical protein VEF04_22525 [Blastocatellia bacterium]|nr:hypothetical protein [Blastocatellia bacterium]
MTATALLNELRERGFILEPQGEGIKIKPASALTSEQRARIKSLKAELLQLLLGTTCPSCLGPLTIESGKGWLHKFCPARVGHYDYWEGLGNWAREQGMKTGRDLMNEQIAQSRCPNCEGELSCQDERTSRWQCQACALAIIGGQIQ